MKLKKLLYRIVLQFRILIRLRFNPSLKQPNNQPPKGILVGATFLLGDMVMTAPLIQAIKMEYPSAHLTILVNKGFKELAACMNGVDEVIERHPKDPAWLISLLKKYPDGWDLGIIPFINHLA